MQTTLVLLGTASFMALLGGIYYLEFHSPQSLEKKALTNADIIKQTYAKYSNKLSGSSLDMLFRMWEIESQKSNPLYMERIERHLPSSQLKWSLYDKYDASLGGLQILTGTANWLYSDMGYKSEGKPTIDGLRNNMAMNTYFAMAYIDWVAKRAKKSGKTISDKFIVMSYNGGYGADNPQTNRHYNKYLKAEGI